MNCTNVQPTQMMEKVSIGTYRPNSVSQLHKFNNPIGGEAQWQP
jgi:hypothetical protein